MQMYVGRLCVNALTHTGRRESPPRNPGPSPHRAAGFRQRWFYACECTHAALSLEARHWLLKRVAGSGLREGESFQTGDHGEAPSVSDGRADLCTPPIGNEKHRTATHAKRMHHTARKPSRTTIQQVS
ncbi:unnamed protein product [Arctia plantaginis]|uniref:Uncharacterized protein n=1 Tax=Arctia plantaginis TaxID=874455 RepID=A0A8S0YZ19_ARCPL|nr:unnamed protein product [Arctia plantaginis]